MQIQFYKTSGEKDTVVEYPKSLVAEISDARVLEYIRYVRNATREVIASTKTKDEVSGGGKKPWKQKGTGRARHGSRRSPIWSGGGVTFGPRSNRNFEIKINKKERRAALLAIISAKVKDKTAIGVKELKFSGPKTAQAVGIIEKLPTKGYVGLFLEDDNDNLNKSFRNIAFVKLLDFKKLNPVSLLSVDTLIFSKNSLAELEKVFVKNQAEKQPEVKTKVKKDE